MTRIEERKNNVEDLQQEVAKMKKNLKRKQNRKFFSCGSCLIILIIVIIVFGVWGTYILAKSGLKDMGFFTDKFYREPQPSYIVQTHNMKEKDYDFVESLKGQLTQEVIKQKKISELKFKYLITEAQLSALFKSEIEGKRILGQTIQFAQIAVLGEELELFLKTDKGFVLTLNMLLELKDDKIDLKTKQIKIGNLKVPKFLGNMSIVFMTEKILNQALFIFYSFGKIEAISMFPTTISFDMLINNSEDIL